MNIPPDGLKVIFAGTPDFAAHHLQALIDEGRHEVIAVYTQPDRPAGRGKKLNPSAVKRCALEHNLPVFQPVSLKESDVQAELAAHQADLMIVVAYGLLLPQAVLDIPRYGCFNVHGSILPRWRGAAPIQRALAAGDQETGVTIMQMDRGLDTGDMLLKRYCPIEGNDTSATLHDKLMLLGAEALLNTLDLLLQGALQPEKQNDAEATYAEKISKEEARIDWLASAESIERNIRAYNPFPIAHTEINGERVKIYHADTLKQTRDNNEIGFNIEENDIKSNQAGKILALNSEGLQVACGENHLLITHAQLPNKKAMPIKDILNGKAHPFELSSCFELG